MLYSPLINKVLEFAYKAHHGQIDKSGVPYIFHPYHLAEQMDTEDEVVTALLHDVVEDTSITIDQVKELGLNDEVITAIKLLTHRKDIPYMEYVENLKDNPLARKVKLADLRHNSDESRGVPGDEATVRRHEKYKKAINILLEVEKR